MFLILPLRVEEAEVDRIPWVSIAIASLCVLAFGITWLAPRYPDGLPPGQLVGIYEYWEQHPYLELSEHFTRYIRPNLVARLAQQRAEMLGHPQSLPAPEVVRAEQATLDQRIEELNARAQRSLLRRFGLVPRLGLHQVGWLTHMFLHLGWWHLLGNLFFFYLVGPLLEDVWGRLLFSGFYFIGGLAAAAAHCLLDPSSPALMVGASGAIAACIGAFTLRYAQRQIRLGYFFMVYRVWRGTFLVPAWAWGLFWFGSEVVSFALERGTGGVAVMAHIGGFGFGLMLASALKVSGIEAKYVAPVLEKKAGGWVQHPGITEGLEALARGDRAAAAKAWQRTVAEQPNNPEAQVGLARLELEDGHTRQGMARATRLLEQLVGTGREGAVWSAVEELGPLLDASGLPPALAWRVATAAESGPEGVRPLTEPLYVAAGAAGGALGAKALLRAAQLCLDSNDQARPEVAVQRTRTALAFENVPPDVKAQLEALHARAANAASARPLGATRQVELELASVSLRGQGTPRIIPCRVVGLAGSSLSLESRSGKVTSVQMAEILAVAVGVTSLAGEQGAPARRVILTDLVMSWGEGEQGPTVLRMPSSALGLQSAYPGLPALQAYARFLSMLLEQSGATALPDAQAVRSGAYPSFPDETSFNTALYGAAA